ncbi:MAG: hypothetical protein ABIQ15_05030 [Nocardioides sp.]
MPITGLDEHGYIEAMLNSFREMKSWDKEAQPQPSPAARQPEESRRDWITTW